ncbi:STAS-like domain-containing protein [Chitinimonas taiwanensis]|uniref:STAS-like domain-containing protein n=1 Tax=Chitinimonas taiwanensis TaxID=240412 RepID=UPI0035B19129
MHINVAREFSRRPVGRYATDGTESGEVFRSKFLVPALEKAQTIVIDLDGTRGYGSSFLEEAFGGLARLGIATKESLLARFKFICHDEPALVLEIQDYIRQA